MFWERYFWMFWERYFWMFWERYFWMFWERYFWMFWERYFWMFSEHSTKEKPCLKKQHMLVRYVLKHAAGLSWFWLWAGASLLMTSLNQLKPAAMLQNIPNLFFRTGKKHSMNEEWCVCAHDLITVLKTRSLWTNILIMLRQSFQNVLNVLC